MHGANNFLIITSNFIRKLTAFLLMHQKLVLLAEVVVSPPFVFLPLVKSLLRPDFHVAAQNCWVKKGGAYTGEVRYVFI